MSRLNILSPDALKMMYSTDADNPFVTLLTLSGSGLTSPIRVADNYTGRISETEDNIVYGLTSNSQQFIFMPFSINLPAENDAVISCSISIYDVRNEILPALRNLTTALTCKIELVLLSNPDIVEISLGEDFYLNNITYNSEGLISGNLTVESYDNEPFPSGTFTPTYFQGLF